MGALECQDAKIGDIVALNTDAPPLFWPDSERLVNKTPLLLLGLLALARPIYAGPTDTATPPAMNLPAIETLPDPFALSNGARVRNAADWHIQRERIKTSLAFYEYGFLPPVAPVRLLETANLPDENGAHRQRLQLACGAGDEIPFTLDLRIPIGATGALPIILTGDPGDTPIPDEVARRGYILAQFNRAAFAPDDDSRRGGIYALFPDTDCGTLGGWAWGYARAIDYLTTRADVDAGKIIIAGHSRGGKAVLLAGALDERVALTVGAQSGTGGAAPYRIGGKNSESLAQATGRFNHWFGPRLQQFAGRETQLPFDQHELLALVAPRHLLLLNGLADPYSNVEAAQQSFMASREVFDFLGAPNNIGLHLREGGHSFSADDWRALLDFADRQLRGRHTTTQFEGLSASEPAFAWRAPQR